MLRLVHNIRSSERSIICLCHVATGSAYKMIWTRIAYAGIFYSSVHTRCNTRPNHFVCTSGRNASSSVYCEPAFTSASVTSLDLGTRLLLRNPAAKYK